MEQLRQENEVRRQAAVRLNELAGSIRTEVDARMFIDAVAEQYTGKHRQSWLTRGIRHRVAHAEYEAVSGPSGFIPEERIVNVWNEYVRELDAPEEALVTVAEVHNLRDAMLTSSQHMWKNETARQFWTIPSIYAVDADGNVASGCRAVEALKILHDMFNSFQSIWFARERVERGQLVSDEVKQRERDGTPPPPLTPGQLKVMQNRNPLPEAESRYVQTHGERDYQRLLERGFAELFPKQ